MAKNAGVDRRDFGARYNAQKDTKVSRTANVQETTGVAQDARGMVFFNTEFVLALRFTRYLIL